MKNILFISLFFFTFLQLNLNCQKKELSCLYLEDYPKNIDLIKNNSKQWLKGNDSCVIGIIDTLIFDYTSKKCEQFIFAIDSICQNADGYVSELLVNSIGIVFENNTLNLIRYLFKISDCNRKYPQIIIFLIEFLNDKFCYYKNKIQMIDTLKLNKYLTKLINNNELSKKEEFFIRNLLKDVSSSKIESLYKKSAR